MPDSVTVYIPTHNRKHLLTRAIDSVLAQTYSPIEIIVVDDGSSDGTETHLDRYITSKKIRFIRNETAKGACYSRNAAIKAANGEYITGLDDDDEFTPERIENFIQATNTDSAFLFTGYLLKEPRGIRTYERGPAKQGMKNLLKRNTVGSQIFVKKDKILAVGCFDETLPAWQDYDLWLRIIEKYGTAKRIPGYTYVVDTTHDHERISSNPENIDKAYAIFQKKYAQFTTRKYQRFLKLFYYQYEGIPFPLLSYLSFLPTPAAKRATKIYLDKLLSRLSRQKTVS